MLGWFQSNFNSPADVSLSNGIAAPFADNYKYPRGTVELRVLPEPNLLPIVAFALFVVSAIRFAQASA